LIREMVMDNKLLIEKKKLELELGILYPKKELLVGYALLFVAGCFGAHRFYLGKTATALAQIALLVSSIFFFGVPAIFLSFWLLLDIFFVFAITHKINDKMEHERLHYVNTRIKGKAISDSKTGR